MDGGQKRTRLPWDGRWAMDANTLTTVQHGTPSRRTPSTALLENQIIPEFYQRNQAGIPAAWVARIRESMGRLAPQYSANRAVRQYCEEHYLPAALAYAARAQEGGKLGAEILAWQRRLAADWNGISFGPLQVEPKDGAVHFEVPVYLGKLDPEAVRVELFAEDLRKVMDRGSFVTGQRVLL